MELRVIFLYTLAWLLVSVVAVPVKDREPFFMQMFELLHGEPPVDESQTREVTPISTKWIEQKLDNFDENNNVKWQMRYMVNDAYYKSGGPLFIYVGAEWAIHESSIRNSHVVDLAKENNGCLFYTEHRFYGESKPTVDMSVENFQYLNVQQALADLAHFVRTIKTLTPGAEDSKVILVGGSYAATMVTWFIQTYPDLATGGWASSGPLLAKLNFVDYKEVMGRSILNVGGETCYKRIQNSFVQMESLVTENRFAEIKSMLKLCNNFNGKNILDIWNLFNEISETFALVIQRSKPSDIEDLCQSFTTKDDDYINLANFMLTNLNSAKCNDMTYNSIVKSLNNTVFRNSMVRQWMYQSCNEFGWFQTSESKNQPFGTLYPLKFYTTMCADLFGSRFTIDYIQRQVQNTNKLYNDLEPGVRNVFFTQGGLDPWSSMGINDNINGAVIPLASHCNDLRVKSPRDSIYLNAARDRISKLVKEWLYEESENEYQSL